MPRDFYQAFWYNSFAFNQGFKEALCMQRMFYFYGIPVEHDFVKTRILFEQSNVSSKRYDAIDISIEKANYYLGLSVKEGVQGYYYPITVDETYIRSIREKAIQKFFNMYKEIFRILGQRFYGS